MNANLQLTLQLPKRKMLGTAWLRHHSVALARLLRFYLTGIAFAFLSLSLRPALAETNFELTPEVDRLLRKGLDAIYHYELESADQQFDELVRRFPSHPIGYTQKAEIIWWRALRSTKDKSLQASFERFTSEAFRKGEELLNQNPNDFYALFYLACAYGNQTRYGVYVTRSYYRAMRSGLDGYEYVKRAHQLNPDYVDCFIGIGAYNYFAGSLPWPVRMFSPLFGVKGDKAKGFEHLKLAAEKGEYGQTVAKMVLLIAYFNEKQFEECRKLLLELMDEFPTNPVFVTWMADLYSQRAKLDEGIRFLSERASKLKDSSSLSPLITSQIHFEIGRLQLRKGAFDDSITSFNKVMSQEINDAPLRTKSLLFRGFSQDLKKQRQLAVSDYRKVLDMTDVDDSQELARTFLNRPYQGRMKK
jgi:tetratricopeptide (TPR) repeat protein